MESDTAALPPPRPFAPPPPRPFVRSSSALNRTVASGGFSSFFERLKEAGESVAEAVDTAHDNMQTWYAAIDLSRKKKNMWQRKSGGDKMRILQANRIAGARAKSATVPLQINVFESYDYDPVRSRFRSQIESEEESSGTKRLDRGLLAENLMQVLVPVVLGVSVAALAVVSAEVGGELVELRWERTKAKLTAGADTTTSTSSGSPSEDTPKILGFDASIFTSAYPTFTIPAMCLAGLAALLTTMAPAAAGSGIPQVKAELNGVRVPGALSASTLAVKLIGVTLVVASGLPCGREGPMVQLGAGVASLVLHAHNKVLSSFFSRSAHTEGRLLDEDLDTRDFVAMGAAAGVASAFDAPIGGVLFALEEVSTHWSTKLTWLSFFSALVAALTTSSLKATVNGEINDEGLFVVWGSSADAKFASKEIPFFLLTGVIGGLLGAAFNRLNGKVNERRRKWYASEEPLCLCRWLGVRTVKVLEAVFLAWLVASCFFILPLLYPCTSILEAVAGSGDADASVGGVGGGVGGGGGGGVDGGGVATSDGSAAMAAMVSAAMRSGGNVTALLLAAEAAKSTADVGAARAAAELAEDFLVDMRCAEPHSYNQMATITLSSQHHVIQALFTRNAIGVLFTPTSLLLSLGLIWCLTVLVYGATIPSGLFVPCMTMGALLGRLMGELVYMAPIDVFPDAGFYALVGAAAMLAGVTRMTISLTVCATLCRPAPPPRPASLSALSRLLLRLAPPPSLPCPASLFALPPPLCPPPCCLPLTPSLHGSAGVCAGALGRSSSARSPTTRARCCR
jgi:H+/Cl- antiporter ClcA